MERLLGVLIVLPLLSSELEHDVKANRLAIIGINKYFVFIILVFLYLLSQLYFYIYLLLQRYNFFVKRVLFVFYLKKY